MAQLPKLEELEIINKANQAAISAKALLQSNQGKQFLVAADGHGPGVVPESIWQTSKIDATKEVKSDA